MFKIFNCLVLIFFAGCATYQNKVAPARQFLLNNDCTSALKELEKLSTPAGGDQLVYLLDYGSALQICGDIKKSNEVFLKAEELSENNDYHSVSKITGATLLNEEMIQYKGDTFEKLFINASLALNFLQLGRKDSALVEVRKMNLKFDKLLKEEKRPFELNSFSKYLSALIWELDKKNDDACIDYKDAYFIDTQYRQVGEEMLRSCWQAQRQSEFEQLAKKMNATSEEVESAKKKSTSEVILLVQQGWGPRKVPRDQISARLQPVFSQTRRVKLSLDGKDYFSDPIYSVTDAAIKTLEADYASLVARRVGARVAKEVLADQLRQKDSALGAAAWLVMVVSERADLRQWSMLPETLQVIRVPLKAGTYKGTLVGIKSNGEVSENFPDLDLKIAPKEKKLFLFRTVK